MKSLITTILAALLFSTGVLAQDNGRIKATVVDEKGEPMIGAVVRVVAGGPMTGGATGVDGTCMIAGLTPGSYDVEVRQTGYKRYVKTGIQVSAGQTAYMSYNMVQSTDTLGEIVIKAIQGPLDPTFSTVESINAFDVKHAASAKGDMIGMISNKSSQVQVGAGGQLVMRGSREGASTMYVDGEKMYGSSGVTAMGISQVSILSGGIPAEYGDLSGGAIIITTHSFYTGMAQQQRMYTAAAEKEVADSAAALEKSGKRVENNTEVIEKQEQPQGEQQPAPAEDPAPEGEQPKEAVEPK